MKNSKPRFWINLLSVSVLFMTVFVRNSILSLATTFAFLLVAILVLIFNLNELIAPSSKSQKNAVKASNILAVALLIICFGYVFLRENQIITPTYEFEKAFATLIVSSIIIFFGCISSKIPFNRYLGLRLPWTVTDEGTWILAHRILGMISFPLAIIYIAGIIALPDSIAKGFTVFIAIVWLAIPSGLSAFYYHKKMQGKL